MVYTVLMGGYEPLLEQHVAARYGIDLVCFTDDCDAASRTWKIRHVDPRFPLDPVRSARRPKLLAHEYLPDYDESIYVDNSVLLTAEPAEIFGELLPDDVAMGILAHSFRGALRDEFEAVVAVGADAPWICEEQRSQYEAQDPASLDEQTLWSGLIVRRHHDEAVRRTMALWWEHVLRFSRRDQLSLPLVLRTCGLDVAVHRLDNLLSHFHEWPRGAAQHVRAARQLSPGPESRLAELEQRATALEAARTEAVAERDALRARIASLERSTSWQITRPLRAMSSVARSSRSASA